MRSHLPTPPNNPAFIQTRMPSVQRAVETLVSRAETYHFPLVRASAAACLVWYSIVAFVCTIGFVQLFVYLNTSPGDAHRR